MYRREEIVTRSNTNSHLRRCGKLPGYIIDAIISSPWSLCVPGSSPTTVSDHIVKISQNLARILELMQALSAKRVMKTHENENYRQANKSQIIYMYLDLQVFVFCSSPTLHNSLNI